MDQRKNTMKCLNKITKTTIYLLMALCWILQPIAIFSQTDIDKAWQAFGKNEYKEAEKYCKQYIAQNPNDTRGYITLSFVYDMMHRKRDSWNAFKNVLKTEKDPMPYFFSQWTTQKISGLGFDTTSDVWQTVEKIAVQGDKGGTLSAMAHQVLAGWYQRKNKLATAKKHFDAIGAIEDWTIIGPFENISASGFNKVYPPEKVYDTSANYEGKNGVPAQWFTPPVIRFDKWVDMQSYFPDRQVFLYANTFVYSPVKRNAWLRVGTSGAVKVFLNDVEIIRDSNEMNNDFDTYITETELQQGWNRVCVKVGYAELDRCNFLARVTDELGKSLPGVVYSKFSKQYPSGIIPSIMRPVENFAESFFKQLIKQKPNQLENYFLLADCYLRNDKAIEAELILREAQKISPDNGLIYKYFLDAYGRGRKRDEVVTTYEKMYALNKRMIEPVLYKFNQHLSNEDFNKAEEMLAVLDTILPERDAYDGLRIDLYSKKKQFDKVIELGRESYKKYPSNWRFVSLMAAIDYQTTRSYEGSISVYKEYCKRDYNETGLTNLAETYLKASKKKEWEQTFRELLIYSPSSPGYYFTMANVFTQQQEYARATEQINKSLAFCPTCNAYWSKLGEIQRSQKNIPASIESYKKALEYLATDYDSRETLRELQGKKSIFALFGESNRDSLIRTAVSSSDFPEANAAIILDRHLRAFYKEGASETSRESLVRLFNERGIDALKEYRIPFNPYSQKLTIEKAITLKPDGTEIRADVDRNYVVFKSLEKNDFIYLKWKVRDFNSGKLTKHFWDEFYFNAYMPVINSEYALLMPENLPFNSQSRNGAPQPVRRATEDGILYQWKVMNEQPIVFEAGMPGRIEVGKMLRISTIPSWDFLVDWYRELAQTKAQSSYEIKELIKQLIPQPEKLTDEEKIQIVFRYITENIRYSSVSFRQSGLVPQKARDVLVDKIGDCKDVSTLGIALLREVGIKAHYVLVNSGSEDRIGEIPPSIEFNHCIAAVEKNNNEYYYLDFTAFNHPPGAIPGMDRSAFSLIIKDGETKPILLPRKQVNNVPTLIVRSVVSLANDLKADFVEQVTMTGTATANLRFQYRGKPSKEREKSLQSSLSVEYPNVKLTALQMSDLEQLTSKETYIYSYTIPNFLTEAGSYRLLKMPWQNGLEPDNSMSYESRRYPIRSISPVDTVDEEVTIAVPEGFTLVELPKSKNLSVPSAEYAVVYQFDGKFLRARRRIIYKSSYIETNDYEAYKKFYATIVKEDKRVVLFKTEE